MGKLNELQRLHLSKVPSKKFRLTGNRNEDMQDNIICAAEGDEIYSEYDLDKDRHMALRKGLEIRQLPRSRQ